VQEAIFVYGTLREPDVLQRLIGRVVAGAPDFLHGYERRYDLFPPYMVAMPAPDAVIDGVVLEITPAELAVFDEYEGKEYIRVRVQLASKREAWVYRGNPALYGAG
jgi:gamma-glutamylcyclotransferase (GGCT)/AIG2-like uncharacterized protein YtfP